MIESWYEVRMLNADGNWTYLAGPLHEDAAHSLIDGLAMPGRTVAVVSCEVWSKVTL